MTEARNTKCKRKAIQIQKDKNVQFQDLKIKNAIYLPIKYHNLEQYNKDPN